MIVTNKISSCKTL